MALQSFDTQVASVGRAIRNNRGTADEDCADSADANPFDKRTHVTTPVSLTIARKTRPAIGDGWPGQMPKHCAERRPSMNGFGFRGTDIAKRVECDLGFPGAIRLYFSADLPESAIRSDSSSSAIVLPVFGIT